jgi:hypothetical protein
MLPRIKMSAIRKFSYCPRWYYIQYVIGFNPKAPVKAKFPISDAIRGCLVAGSASSYRERVAGLMVGETPAEEPAPFHEMVSRGELLLEQAMKWRNGLQEILWAEQLIEYRAKVTDEVYLPVIGYPDLLAKQQGKTKLYNFRLAYMAYGEREQYGDAFESFIYKKALEQHLNLHIDELVTVSMIIRSRKERNAKGATTPIIEMQEHVLEMEEGFDNIVDTTVLGVSGAIEAEAFPALGLRNGVCSWCPNRASIKGQRFCCFSDDILKKISESSLQRSGIDKWRDDF